MTDASPSATRCGSFSLRCTIQDARPHFSISSAYVHRIIDHHPTRPRFPVGTHDELYFGYSSISQLFLHHIHYKRSLTLITQWLSKLVEYWWFYVNYPKCKSRWETINTSPHHQSYSTSMKSEEALQWLSEVSRKLIVKDASKTFFAQSRIPTSTLEIRHRQEVRREQDSISI